MERGRRVKGFRRGLTLVELTIAMLASSIMFLAIAGVLTSNHKQWNQTYERVHGDIVTDAYATRLTFDRIVRQASIYECYPLDLVSTSMTLYLYTNIQNLGTDPPLNRYATFTFNGTELILEQGPYDDVSGVAGSADSSQVLARHVTSCSFWRTGPCIHLAMVLNDGSTNLPVAMTATRHNP